MNQQEEKYANGRLFVRPGIDDGEAIRKFIRSRQFLDTRAMEPVNLTNRRNRLFRLALRGFPKPFMLKVNWINPEFSLRRRIALFVNSRLKNYPRRGYAGAMALEEAAIAGMRAIAYWNYQPGTMRECGYFLYEEIEADCSIGNYQTYARRDANPSQQQVFNVLVMRAAELVRKMHQANLRHGSIEFGNFLVSFGCPMEQADVDSASAAKLFLIDTDRMTRVKIRNRIIKKIFDVRDLCRISIDRQGREYLLRCYLGDAYSAVWQMVLELWYTRHVGATREYRENHPDFAQPRP